MDNLIPLILFTVEIVSIFFYFFFKFKTIKYFSFGNTFPFEHNSNSTQFKVSIFTCLVFAVCSVLFYFTIYTNNFTNSYILIATISSLIISFLFFTLNVVNLVNLKAHFFLFSLFAALVTTQSVVMGFHSINAYTVDGKSWLFILLAVIFFIEAVMELLLVSPIFKFSFLMEVNQKNEEYKKPNFIRLAFYEWLYLFLFILNSFLLLIERSI